MPAWRNLAGQRFGKLTALEYFPGPYRRSGKWRCQCDCGGVAMCLPQSLVSSGSTSCGCGRVDAVQQAHNRKRPAIGDRRGRLVVVGSLGKNVHGSVMWSCLCDCGASTRVTTSHWNGGMSRSCGGCGLLSESLRRYYEEHPERTVPEDEQKARIKAYTKRISDRLAARQRKRAAREREELHRNYIAKVLSQNGLRISGIPAHLIEIKREQLRLLRLAKQLQQATKKADE